MAGYSGFGFCAAHAHSYALTAYRSAYMKAHYPAVYLAAQINNGGGYYGPSVYIEDARRLHVKLLVPHINESGAWCEVPPGSGDQRSIRVGLQFVKGLSEKTIGAILNERRNGGRFHSLLDLMARVEVGPQEITALVKVGACEDLGANSQIASIAPIQGSLGEVIEVAHAPATTIAMNRKQMMWLIPSLLAARELRARGTRRTEAGNAKWALATGSDRQSIQVVMGDLIEHEPVGMGRGTRVLGDAHRRIDVPALDDYTLAEKVKLEKEALGFTLIRNEMELVEVQDALPSSQLNRHAACYSEREVKVAGVIAAGRKHLGKNGEWMLFLTLQDREGLIEVVIFSDAYKECKEILASYGYGPYIISGTVQVK